jgi:hypothetical protein
LQPGEKQSELLRHRDLLLATIDYLILQHADSFVVDNEDHTRHYYEQEKRKAEKNYKNSKLDILQKKLEFHWKTLQHNVDLNFANFIKDKTGYEIDLFADVRTRVDSILSRNSIRNKKEERDISTMLHYFINSGSSTNIVNELKALLSDYHNRIQKKRNKQTEVINTLAKDGLLIKTISVSTGSKPTHFKEEKIVSPDGFRKLLIVQWSDGDQAATSVTLQFANGASGAIYSTKGIHPNITASWIDNSTVLIRTRNAYDIEPRHKEVRSFDDSITIRYAEVEHWGLGQ